ncbi:MAG: type II secretion system protein [Chlamydiae bacterium]|nr:type II secretion system protein [Chlamydiota bacterium]
MFHVSCFMLLTTHDSRLTTKKGFTLFEIVIALGILAIGILGILALFPVGLDAQKRAMDYGNMANLAEWKMADIYYRSHLSGFDNSLTAALDYPTSGPDPAPFTQNSKYLWHYSVSQPFVSTLPDFYRVDLEIYSVEDTSNSIEKVVNYFEKPN